MVARTTLKGHKRCRDLIETLETAVEKNGTLVHAGDCEQRCGSSYSYESDRDAARVDKFVYHFHHGGEELLIVLRGTPTVPMRDGDSLLKEGDVLPFPRGLDGGHQIRNDAESVTRVLIVGGHVNPDVAKYDTGKVATIIGGDHRFHRASDEVTHAGPE